MATGERFDLIRESVSTHGSDLSDLISAQAEGLENLKNKLTTALDELKGTRNYFLFGSRSPFGMFPSYEQITDSKEREVALMAKMIEISAKMEAQVSEVEKVKDELRAGLMQISMALSQTRVDANEVPRSPRAPKGKRYGTKYVYNSIYAQKLSHKKC